MDENLTARRIFRWAGIYGLIVLVPALFLEARVGIDAPPPITHPEYYYGFIGLAIAWQLARSPVVLPIPGTSKVTHLEENLGAVHVALDEVLMSELAGGEAAA